MNRTVIAGWFAAIGLICAMTATTGAMEPRDRQVEDAGSRTFRFDYGATVDELPAASRVRVWLPVPQSNEHQTVAKLERALPAEGKTDFEPTHGNQILYFETNGPTSGELRFSTSYRVKRQEVRGLDGVHGEGLTERQSELYLSPNKKVPLQGKQLRLLDGLKFSTEPLDIARSLYRRVDDHVRYDKSKPGYGNGDVHWVCDSRYGNCTDFHSLFISWARAKGLPARFEIGFPLPPQRSAGTIGGYHCWAFFHDAEKGWVPVDISEADKHPEMKDYYFGNLTENRVTFTTGRDIMLVPQQDGEPLNYFVYPYVEVDGKPWPKKYIKPSFRFADEAEKGTDP